MSALVFLRPSYHELIATVQYEVLGYIWRVPARPTATVSDVPHGRMSGTFEFLLALLWIESAAAGELRPLVAGVVLLPRQAAVEAVRPTGLRCVRGRGLRAGRAGAHGGRLGVETKAASGGGGGRRRRVEVR